MWRPGDLLVKKDDDYVYLLAACTQNNHDVSYPIAGRILFAAVVELYNTDTIDEAIGLMHREWPLEAISYLGQECWRIFKNKEEISAWGHNYTVEMVDENGVVNPFNWP